MVGILSAVIRTHHDHCGGTHLSDNVAYSAQEREEIYAYHQRIRQEYDGRKKRK